MTVTRKTKGGLLIPVNAAGVRQLTKQCMVCGAEFYDDEQGPFERHVAKCCRENEDAIHMVSPRTVLPAFESSEGWDQEYERWVRENPGRWKAERGIPS